MSIQADITFERELWETAVTLRGTVAPGDYKHYVLPLLFLRYLSLGYEQRHQQLELMLKDQRSEYFTGDPTVDQEIPGGSGRVRCSQRLRGAGAGILRDKVLMDQCLTQSRQDV